MRAYALTAKSFWNSLGRASRLSILNRPVPGQRPTEYQQPLVRLRTDARTARSTRLGKYPGGASRPVQHHPWLGSRRLAPTRPVSSTSSFGLLPSGGPERAGATRVARTGTGGDGNICGVRGAPELAGGRVARRPSCQGFRGARCSEAIFAAHVDGQYWLAFSVLS